MNLELEQRGTMHSSLIAQLEAVAAQCSTLDEAMAAVDALKLNAHWWQVYRGGNHIALLFRVNNVNFQRAALLTVAA